MNIVTTGIVQVLDKLYTNEHELPYYNDIRNVYLGYRQCYTKNPLENHLLTENSTIDDIKNSFIKSNSTFTNTIMYNNFIDQHPTESIYDWYDEIKLLNYIQMCQFIMKHSNHESPLEHSKVTVRFSNIDRSVSHQLVRHRIASYSQASQRYIDENDPIVIIPKSIQANEQAREIFIKTIETIQKNYKALKDLNDPRIKNEDIRSIFPNAYGTEIVVTMNFRALKHFFHERCCMRAQLPIRTIANQLLTIIQHEIPYLFDHEGPKCFSLGYCPEENSTCHYFKTKKS